MNSEVTRELGYFAFPCRCSAATHRTISKLDKKGAESFLLGGGGGDGGGEGSGGGGDTSPVPLRLLPGAFSLLLLHLHSVINEADCLILVHPVVEIEAIKWHWQHKCISE